jgi:hypothetical protein
LGLNPGLHDEKLSSVQLCSLLNLIETSEKGFVTVVAVRYQKRGSNQCLQSTVVENRSEIALE